MTIENTKVSISLDTLLSMYKIIDRLDDLVLRFKTWDHLLLTGDGPFWLKEIDKVYKLWQEESQKRKSDWMMPVSKE